MRPLSRYRQKKLDAAFARAQRVAALKAQDGRCAYCLDPLTAKQATRDHVRSRASGGLDHSSNIKAACQPCNSTKGCMPYDLFMRMITSPKPGEPWVFRMIWVSRRLNRALMRMEKNLSKATGRKR